MPRSLIRSNRLHLSQAGESYLEHMRFASAVGSMLVAAGVACLIHAIVPGICRDTASRTIRCLDGLIKDRSNLESAKQNTVESVAFALLMVLAAGSTLSLLAIGPASLLGLVLTMLTYSIPAALIVTNPDLRPIG
jgi:hypothetical protein